MKNNYRKSVLDPKDGYRFGGLEKGSVGIVISDPNRAQSIVSHEVIIDGHARKYAKALKQGQHVVIEDDRIWNPTPYVTIVFYDRDNFEVGRLMI